MPEEAELLFFKSRLSSVESLMIFKQRQIDSILEITRAINQNLPLIALSRTLEAIIFAQLGIQKSAMLIKGVNWDCTFYQGSNNTLFLEKIGDYIQLFDENRYVVKIDSDSEYEVAIPVFFKDDLISVTLLGGFKEDHASLHEEKIKFVQTLTNLICVAIENKRLSDQEARQKLVERDLFLASEIQRVLIPKEFPQNDHFKVSAFYKPYRNIGGDYYDFIRVKEDKYFFCMCDISGKGIAAAMLMANFQASLRFTINQDFSLIDSVNILNKSLLAITKGDSFITAFFGILDCKRCELEFVNAGHNPPLLLKQNEIVELKTGCTILGIIDTLPIIESEIISIPLGATLITYTDGLTEASNENEELFGEERLREFIEKNKNEDAELINLNLIQEILQFSKKDLFDDDISLMTIRFSNMS